MTMRMHETEQEPGHTPEIWRYMLSAIMMRYSVRWLKTPLHDKISDNVATAMTDTATGLLSSYVVANHVRKTVKQINTLYREVVALELGKDPEDVTWRDFYRSGNDIVKDALGNLVRQNLQRGLAAVVPFIGPLGKLAIHFFDHSSDEVKAGRMQRLDNTFEAGLGAIGVVQFIEVNRKRSIFEHVRSFVSKEMNPGHTLEVHLDLNDLHHLYQSYSKKYQPHSYFRHADRDQDKEGYALMLFDRMAELMNASYQSQVFHQNGVHFNMPHFLYLMGHRHIDLTKPEQTALFVEVMAKHGAQAVKQMSKELEAGAPVQQLAAKYEVTVDLAKLRESYVMRHPAHTRALGEENHGHNVSYDRVREPEPERRFTDSVKKPEPKPQPRKSESHANAIASDRLTPAVTGVTMRG